MRTILCAFFAGLAVTVWTVISWMLLPWHETHLLSFRDPATVAEVLTANAPVPGIYMLPDAYDDQDPNATWEAGAQRMREGPFLFGSLRQARPNWSFTGLLLKNFALQVVVALLITLLVRAVRIENYLGRMFFVGAFGLIAGLLGQAPNTIWWEFPLGWTMVNVAELVIGWCIAGMIIAYFTRPRMGMIGGYELPS